MWMFWDWVREESIRAAEMKLLGFIYAPALVIEEPPAENGNYRLTNFALVKALPDGPLGGRPAGSQIFSTPDEFLLHVRRAVQELRLNGRKTTQAGVADHMSFNEVFGVGDPARQLRRLAQEFGYHNWKDLLSAL